MAFEMSNACVYMPWSFFGLHTKSSASAVIMPENLPTKLFEELK